MKPDGEASAKPFHGWTKSNLDQEQVNKNILGQGQIDKNIIEQGQVDKNIIEQGHVDKKMVEHDQRLIIIVCKDEKDCINPETGVPYVGF